MRQSGTEGGGGGGRGEVPSTCIPLTTDNPVFGDKLLGSSIARAFGSLKGFTSLEQRTRFLGGKYLQLVRDNIFQ